MSVYLGCVCVSQNAVGMGVRPWARQGLCGINSSQDSAQNLPGDRSGGTAQLGSHQGPAGLKCGGPQLSDEPGGATAGQAARQGTGLSLARWDQKSQDALYA